MYCEKKKKCFRIKLFLVPHSTCSYVLSILYNTPFNTFFID